LFFLIGKPLKSDKDEISGYYIFENKNKKSVTFIINDYKETTDYYNTDERKKNCNKTTLPTKEEFWNSEERFPFIIQGVTDPCEFIQWINDKLEKK
jgi:hypothetical protein